MSSSSNNSTNSNEPRRLYGLSCSYFTGKLEAYFRSKGIPFEFVEMNRAIFLECAKATGILQMPCTREPDGRWLTDTTKIMEHFEASDDFPKIRPTAPAAAFFSALLEDLFDEWYWRPALYYRWANADDARLLSTEIARELLRDLPLPLFLRRWFILARQRRVFLKQDGVTQQTAPAIEQLYLDSLAALDVIFSKRPFLFGDRPCEADYGLFGPFFRHFFCDPTASALMRKRAPHLLNWVTRLWSTRPDDLQQAAAASAIPDDLGYFCEMISEDYLPYLAANAEAVARGDARVRYHAQGVDWEIPSAPYRALCLNDLKGKFTELTQDARAEVAQHLSQAAMGLLSAPPTEVRQPRGVVGRLWRST